jgi:hypothetical protein
MNFHHEFFHHAEHKEIMNMFKVSKAGTGKAGSAQLG